MSDVLTKKNTFAVMSFCFIAYSQTGINPIIQKLIIAYPEISASTARLVSTIPAISAFICAIFVGSFVGQKIKYRTVCCLSCIFWTIGGLMPIFLNQRFEYILISRLIFGIGTGFALCYNALIISTYPTYKRAKMLGLALFMVNAGSMVAQMMGGFLGEIQFQYAFYIYLICPIELIIVFLFLKEPEINKVNEYEKVAFKLNKVTNKKTVKTVAVILIASVVIWPVSSGMSTFIADRNIGSSAVSGLVLSLYTLGGVFAGSLLDTTKKLKRFAIPFVFMITATGFAFVLIGYNTVLVSIGSILCGFGYFTTKPLFTLYLSYELSQKAMTFAATLILAATNLGIFISNSWISLTNTVFSNLFSTEIERVFFAGILVNLLFAISFRADPKSISEKVN